MRELFAAAENSGISTLFRNPCNRRDFLKQSALMVFSAGLAGCAGEQHIGDARGSGLPNIVYILADDLGYGDVSCLNEDSRLHTSRIDSLAAAGMRFTDAHSGSAVCTPTRYGILTGRYAWRSRLKKGVLGGYSPHLIEEGRTTCASLLKRRGYHCACIGKWHLGWDWAKSGSRESDVDFTKPVTHGPRSNGFDYSFCIPASADMGPYVYVENDMPTALPTEKIERSKGKQLMWEGVKAPDLQPEELLSRFTRKAVSYINVRAKDNGTPFFLYFPMTAPHTPILPAKEFLGKSGTNEYGDFVLQVDDCVGQVLDALERGGLSRNTLVFFTSDNGCAPMADFDELAEFGHDPSYVFRGAKADIYEGGHRIPFIARWPGVVRRGEVSGDTICLTDLLRTLADITGEKLAPDEGEDSVSIMPALTGKVGRPLREAIVHHSNNGSFSIRQGKWKLELCAGSGGWSSPRPGSDAEAALPPVQLYDLSKDISEQINLQDKHPDVVRRLSALLQQYKDSGRSVPL
jgi:arylsulfatase A-like enzyme